MSLFFRTLAALVLLAAACAIGAAQQVPPTHSAGVEFFEKRVRPLLAANCYQCHASDKKRSGLALDSVAAMLAGGERGPALVPGQPEKSLLMRAINHGGEPKMPPKGKLTDQQIADLTARVQHGSAGFPKDNPWSVASPKNDFDLGERRKHWAYQPVKLSVASRGQERFLASVAADEQPSVWPHLEKAGPCRPRFPGRPPRLDPPRDVRLDRLAADASGGGRVPDRQIAGGFCQGG